MKDNLSKFIIYAWLLKIIIYTYLMVTGNNVISNPIGIIISYTFLLGVAYYYFRFKGNSYRSLVSIIFILFNIIIFIGNIIGNNQSVYQIITTLPDLLLLFVGTISILQLMNIIQPKKIKKIYKDS